MGTSTTQAGAVVKVKAATTMIQKGADASNPQSALTKRNVQVSSALNISSVLNTHLLTHYKDLPRSVQQVDITIDSLKKREADGLAKGKEADAIRLGGPPVRKELYRRQGVQTVYDPSKGSNYLAA